MNAVHAHKPVAKVYWVDRTGTRVAAPKGKYARRGTTPLKYEQRNRFERRLEAPEGER